MITHEQVREMQRLFGVGMDVVRQVDPLGPGEFHNAMLGAMEAAVEQVTGKCMTFAGLPREDYLVFREVLEEQDPSLRRDPA